jgi:hypothetical protein
VCLRKGSKVQSLSSGCEYDAFLRKADPKNNNVYLSPMDIIWSYLDPTAEPLPKEFVDRVGSYQLLEALQLFPTEK